MELENMNLTKESCLNPKLLETRNGKVLVKSDLNILRPELPEGARMP
jgi:hypothetical protein